MRIINSKLTHWAIALFCVAAVGTGCSDDGESGNGSGNGSNGSNGGNGGTPDAGNGGGPSLSPDWSEQIIYFVMIDRFDNGDTTNDALGAVCATDPDECEYNPSSNAHFSGGDLQGIIDRLNYIRAMGATAIWITPPVANQWWDPVVNFGGYHGYWARNHKLVDEHFGTLAKYKELADELHERDMYLIQDIVPNHVGNFFYYEDELYNPNDVTENFLLNTETFPTTAPVQPPFDQNDVNNPDHRTADIYHWTPTISDFSDQNQEYNYQLSNLDDVNTENPVVRDALKDSFGYWIDEVGVDGFRIDTVKFIPHDFWNDFIHGTNGVNEVAASTERDDFLTFGEVFEVSGPFQDAGERKALSFLGTESEPELGAVIQFPLYNEINNVFAKGAPTSQMSYRLDKFMELFPDPFTTPTFVDNHDVPRFLQSGNAEALEQSIGLLMTIPGIPIIYYGTEQLLRESREAMFDGGFANPGEDRFDSQTDMFQFIREMSELRKANRVLTRGDLETVADNPAGRGLLAFKRSLDGTEMLVAFNTADEAILVPGLQTGFDSGEVLEMMASRRLSADPVVGENGVIVMELPARALFVARATGQTVEVPAPAATITVATSVDGQTFSEDIVMTGTVEPATTELVAVVDGLLDRSTPAAVDASGNWTVTIPIDQFPIGESSHTVQVYSRAARVGSAAQQFTANVIFDGVIEEIDDPLDDDHGPTGDYTYPTDSTFDREMDIEKLTVAASGSTLQITLLMRQMKFIWAQANGFDHVSFTLFFDVPGSDGLTVLPQLDAEAPTDFAWDFMNVISLQTNDMYTTEGASASNRGTSISAAPVLQSTVPDRTLELTYDRNALGIDDWSGVKVYVTTWDIDGLSGDYRALIPGGGQWEFGGPDGGAKIMDDVGPMTIPPLD